MKTRKILTICVFIFAMFGAYTLYQNYKDSKVSINSVKNTVVEKAERIKEVLEK